MRVLCSGLLTTGTRLVYFFIYTVRIKGWTFGMGSLFDAPGKIVRDIKSRMGKGRGKDEEEEGKNEESGY